MGIKSGADVCARVCVHYPSESTSNLNNVIFFSFMIFFSTKLLYTSQENQIGHDFQWRKNNNSAQNSHFFLPQLLFTDITFED